MKVKLKKINQKAKIPFKARPGDFCYDVIAVSEEEIAPNIWKYGLGLAFEIVKEEQDEMNIAIDFRPRSSVWKTGMILSNCEGTIDELYRGEVMAVFYHLKTDMPRYKVGDRIGQIKLGFTLPMEFEEVEELNMNTERGTGGFGSTGK